MSKYTFVTFNCKTHIQKYLEYHFHAWDWEESLQRNNSIFWKFLLIFQPGNHGDSYVDISHTISCIFCFWWARKNLVSSKFGTSASGRYQQVRDAWKLKKNKTNELFWALRRGFVRFNLISLWLPDNGSHLSVDRINSQRKWQKHFLDKIPGELLGNEQERWSCTAGRMEMTVLYASSISNFCKFVTRQHF